MADRRFPPPWSVDDLEACFVVKDGAGQKLAYVYFEEDPGRRSAAKLLTKGAADCSEYRRQPKFLEWCLTRLDGAGPDTPWYIVLGSHHAPAPVAVAKHC